MREQGRTPCAASKMKLLCLLQDAEAGSPRAAVLAARESLGLSQLESFHVQHCAHAYGVVLESRRGWKLALSGDTRPCPAVAAAAHEATVLIHEVGLSALTLWRRQHKRADAR